MKVNEDWIDGTHAIYGSRVFAVLGRMSLVYSPIIPLRLINPIPIRRRSHQPIQFTAESKAPAGPGLVDLVVLVEFSGEIDDRRWLDISGWLCGTANSWGAQVVMPGIPGTTKTVAGCLLKLVYLPYLSFRWRQHGHV